MNNIVDFGTGRNRPRRSIQVAEDGARILFFTGVRYERLVDDKATSFVAESKRFCEIPTPLGLDGDPVAARHAPV